MRRVRAAIVATYCECVFVALGIQDAMRMRSIILLICGLTGSTVFFHLINGTIFERKKKIY